MTWKKEALGSTRRRENMTAKSGPGMGLGVLEEGRK
jgi:hypothetical protein